MKIPTIGLERDERGLKKISSEFEKPIYSSHNDCGRAFESFTV